MQSRGQFGTVHGAQGAMGNLWFVNVVEFAPSGAFPQPGLFLPDRLWLVPPASTPPSDPTVPPPPVPAFPLVPAAEPVPAAPPFVPAIAESKPDASG
jgi:hypothetical protein